MQNFLQINKFFVSVVTVCDIFYSRFKRFFGLNVFLQNRFKLKKTATCPFLLFLCSFINQYPVAYSQEKI